jgi:hypothetical protein
VRYSHRGTSAGCLGWLVVTLLAIALVCLAQGWPLALANEHGHNGHMAAWGVPAEIGWLLALILIAALVAAVKNAGKPPAGRSARSAAGPEPPLTPRNERLYHSDRR